MYNQALAESRVELFVERMFPVWLDRFPVAILRDDAKSSCDIDLAATERVLPQHKADIRTRLMWMSWDRNSGDPVDCDWETKMTVAADREYRRTVYHEISSPRGWWPIGHQWEVAVPAEERAAVEVREEYVESSWGSAGVDEDTWGLLWGEEIKSLNDPNAEEEAVANLLLSDDQNI
ncbi:hypothetical protein Hypma_013858 [Hypsizygus marmoreus]|uniref:Uncharacterized protein n=1 Tax=Hypsizygus marmoreus TaxID=39966 RepID=A0A369KDE2_HYPMA|nr:hypothetical protein Hypma_013858 [Hypsizygus marmoreus]